MNRSIYVGNVLYPVKVLGPGLRIGIWLVGCSRGCRCCISPEFSKRDPKFLMQVSSLVECLTDLAKTGRVDGITISGGEPFEQPEALRVLLDELLKISPDILVYTGFLKEKLESLGYADILSKIGVLIDGPYIDEKNTGSFMKGSDNQRIFILNPQLQTLYDEYLRNGRNKLQLFRTSTGFVSVGIVKRGFADDLHKRLLKNGVSVSDPQSV